MRNPLTQELALNSPASCGHSIGIVLSRTKATEFVHCLVYWNSRTPLMVNRSVVRPQLSKVSRHHRKTRISILTVVGIQTRAFCSKRPAIGSASKRHCRCKTLRYSLAYAKYTVMAAAGVHRSPCQQMPLRAVDSFTSSATCRDWMHHNRDIRAWTCTAATQSMRTGNPIHRVQATIDACPQAICVYRQHGLSVPATRSKHTGKWLMRTGKTA
jgi:hypothetical protein